VEAEVETNRSGVKKRGLTMVTRVLALSVLVLMVVSEAVLEPMTMSLGTVRLPPTDLKWSLRKADAAWERMLPSREKPLGRWSSRDDANGPPLECPGSGLLLPFEVGTL
jgi:hypothetical protein